MNRSITPDTLRSIANALENDRQTFYTVPSSFRAAANTLEHCDNERRTLELRCDDLEAQIDRQADAAAAELAELRHELDLANEARAILGRRVRYLDQLHTNQAENIAAYQAELEEARAELAQANELAAGLARTIARTNETPFGPARNTNDDHHQVAALEQIGNLESRIGILEAANAWQRLERLEDINRGIGGRCGSPQARLETIEASIRELENASSMHRIRIDTANQRIAELEHTAGLEQPTE